VVTVEVGDNYAERAQVSIAQPTYVRERHLALRRVEGHPEVEEDVLLLALKLDAGAADLGGAAVNPDS